MPKNARKLRQNLRKLRHFPKILRQNLERPLQNGMKPPDILLDKGINAQETQHNRQEERNRPNNSGWFLSSFACQFIVFRPSGGRKVRTT